MISCFLLINAYLFFIEPSFKKLPGAEHLVNPLTVIPAAREFMSSTRMAYIFYGPVEHFQATVHHFAFHKTGTSVVFSMEYDIRGSNILHVGDRRFSLKNSFG